MNWREVENDEDGQQQEDEEEEQQLKSKVNKNLSKFPQCAAARSHIQTFHARTM